MLDALWKFLSSNLFLAIVTFLAGASGYLLFLSEWFNSRRGNYIIVNEISRSPQFKVSALARDRLRVLFDGKPVTDLVLVYLRITNAGTAVIENVKLEITMRVAHDAISETDQKLLDLMNQQNILGRAPDFVEPDFIVDADLFDPDDKSKFTVKDDAVTGHAPYTWTATLERPYLNPHRAFSQEVLNLGLLSSQDLKIEVAGSGPKWRAKYEVATSPQVMHVPDTLIKVSPITLGLSIAGLYLIIMSYHDTTAPTGIGLLLVLLTVTAAFSAMGTSSLIQQRKSKQ